MVFISFIVIIVSSLFFQRSESFRCLTLSEDFSFCTFYLLWFQQTEKKIYKINQLGDFKSERVSHCSINQKRAIRLKICDHSRSISELRMFTIYID